MPNRISLDVECRSYIDFCCFVFCMSVHFQLNGAPTSYLLFYLKHEHQFQQSAGVLNVACKCGVDGVCKPQLAFAFVYLYRQNAVFTALIHFASYETHIENTSMLSDIREVHSFCVVWRDNQWTMKYFPWCSVRSSNISVQVMAMSKHVEFAFVGYAMWLPLD